MSEIRKICAILPHGAVYGGVKRYIESGNDFVRRGYDYAIATANPADWNWFPFHGRSFTIDNRPDEEWDVLILTNPTLADQVQKFRAKIKVINVINGQYARKGYAEAIRLVQPDLVIGCSTSVRQVIPECQHVIPGGIDTEMFSPKRDFSLHRPIRILSYGRRRNPRKRVGDAIAIFNEIKKRSKRPVELHLFDSKSKVSGNGITFHFGLFRDKLADLYRSMDLFISPEEQAGWHNTAAEAMACGLPVCCTPDGTQDFAIDGETALVSGVGDNGSFIKNALSILEDEGLRIKLTHNGVKKTNHFTWAEYNKRLLKKLKEVRCIINNILNSSV